MPENEDIGSCIPVNAPQIIHLKGKLLQKGSIPFPTEIVILPDGRWIWNTYYYQDNLHLLGPFIKTVFDGEQVWFSNPELHIDFKNERADLEKLTFKYLKFYFTNILNHKISDNHDNSDSTDDPFEVNSQVGLEYELEMGKSSLIWVRIMEPKKPEDVIKRSFKSFKPESSSPDSIMQIIQEGTEAWTLVIEKFDFIKSSLSAAFEKEMKNEINSIEQPVLHFTRDYWPTENWSFKKAESVGLDDSYLKSADTYFENYHPSLRSLLIIKNGYMIFEEYYNEAKPDERTHICSATKSITSLVLGSLTDKNNEITVEDPISNFFKNNNCISQINDKQITLRHLLTMSAGFDWSENGPSDWPIDGKTDWFNLALCQKFADIPGTRFNYNSGLSHLISGIIANGSISAGSKYANEFLFSKLGIKDYKWNEDNYGYFIGGFGLELKSRDMAKMGFLALNLGKWECHQIIPEKWVIESTSPQIKTNSNTGIWYGYHWWIQSIGGEYCYYAYGYGGQHIMVIPRLDMVIISTCDENANPQIASYSHLLFISFIENIVLQLK